MPKKAGAKPHFLDVGYFQELVAWQLALFDEVFQEHTGPFIFEFQRTGIDQKDFLPHFDQFLGQLPERYEYAVEVRNPGVLGGRIVLGQHGVSHIYNHLYAMPSLEDQHNTLGSSFTAPFVLFRLLTPRDKKYHDAVKAYEPYDKLVQPLPDMRDQTVTRMRDSGQPRLPCIVPCAVPAPHRGDPCDDMAPGVLYGYRAPRLMLV